MGCILYELAMSQKAFNNDFATQEYKRSGRALTMSLDEYFSDQCRETITRNITLMLRIEPALRPSAVELLEEFCQNFQMTCAQPFNNVQIHYDFKENPQLQQSKEISGLNSSLQGNVGAECFSVLKKHY
jgi:hypothetical protein